MLYFPTGFVFRAGGKPVHYEHRSTREILSPWSWRYFSWAFFTVFLSCRKSVKEKIGRRKKSNSKPYDFYSYNVNKESGGRCTVGQRYLYIWYKSSKPDLVIFNAGVTLLTLAAPDAYQLKWKVGTWDLMCWPRWWIYARDQSGTVTVMQNSSRRGRSVVLIDQCWLFTMG